MGGEGRVFRHIIYRINKIEVKGNREEGRRKDEPQIWEAKYRKNRNPNTTNFGNTLLTFWSRK